MLKQSSNGIILASSSQIRKSILKTTAIDFTIVPAYCNEEKIKKKSSKLSPKELSLFLAKSKALSVSELFADFYVIGSDQVCEFENQEIPKSKNSQEAIAQLTKMSGKTHYQNNSVVVAHKNKIIFEHNSKAKLKMRKITLEEITKYVKKDRPWNCAGSYRYESLGKHLFAEVKGDYYSILGFAIQPLISFLHSKKIISIK